jgi:predicted Zn finger-like uncharacterized protein
MILSCPSCRARYVVPDSAIGAEGRKVRCANCRFSWFQEGPDPSPAPAPPAPRPATAQRTAPAPAQPPPPAASLARVPVRQPRPAIAPPPPPVAFEPGVWREEEPAAETQPEPIAWAPAEPDPSDEEPRRRPRRDPARMWTLAAILAALLMVGALAAIYFVGPQQIAAWVGGGDAAGGERLRFTRRDVSREPLPTDKELLTVTGEITNVSSQVQRLPQIRAEVTDAEGRAIFRWMIAPPVTELQPGQAVTFSSASTDVPKGGRNLNLSFGPTT